LFYCIILAKIVHSSKKMWYTTCVYADGCKKFRRYYLLSVPWIGAFDSLNRFSDEMRFLEIFNFVNFDRFEQPSKFCILLPSRFREIIGKFSSPSAERISLFDKFNSRNCRHWFNPRTSDTLLFDKSSRRMCLWYSARSTSSILLFEKLTFCNEQPTPKSNAQVI